MHALTHTHTQAGFSTPTTWAGGAKESEPGCGEESVPNAAPLPEIIDPSSPPLPKRSPQPHPWWGGEARESYHAVGACEVGGRGRKEGALKGASLVDWETPVMFAELLFQAACVSVFLPGAQGRAYTGRKKLANFAVERYPPPNIHPCYRGSQVLDLISPPLPPLEFGWGPGGLQNWVKTL